jgi:F-type H+-transporting ATPase subunit epsilon
MSVIFAAKIITPSKIILEAQAKEVLLPGQNGVFGVLPLHENLISNLKSGIVSVVDEFDQKYRYFIYGGISRISNSELIITTEYAIDVKDVNKKEIQDEIDKCSKKSASDEAESEIFNDRIKCLQDLLEVIK